MLSCIQMTSNKLENLLHVVGWFRRKLFPKYTFNAIITILLGNSGFEAAVCLRGYRPEFCMSHTISTLLHVTPASALMTAMQYFGWYNLLSSLHYLFHPSVSSAHLTPNVPFCPLFCHPVFQISLNSQTWVIKHYSDSDLLTVLQIKTATF
jgi:hypothetical protein